MAGITGTEAEGGPEQIGKQFSLFRYGSKEAGYRYMLQSYTLHIKIPTILFSLEKQERIKAELDIVFSSGENAAQTSTALRK